MQLGETNNYCQIAVRPANTALGKGANTVLIGATFLQDYYLFFLVNEIVNTVGVAEANPQNIILDAHYRPNSKLTAWLPESRETDQSIYVGDFHPRDPTYIDVYDRSDYMDAHMARLNGLEWKEDPLFRKALPENMNMDVARSFMTLMLLVMGGGVLIGCVQVLLNLARSKRQGRALTFNVKNEYLTKNKDAKDLAYTQLFDEPTAD